MSDTLISIENVSKKFCRTLKRSLWYGMQDMGMELLGKSQEDRALRKDEFWAVKDVCFKVHRGETLGLIGHNGAGKTTMLKMLNGLIKPDSGRIVVRGRMQALIALGAGFNPVLTGRENVYINASVLGIRKAEIDQRFDEIVAFSGLEEFIDMPVQSYSSGMTVRLGFSIAAHLEPDILLVDEVLAVGDIAFKTKCQTRIQQLKQNGVAIVLVSHSLHTISHVCTRAITFEKGKLIFEGDTEEAIDVYRDSLIRLNERGQDTLRAGTGEIRIERLEVRNRHGQHAGEFNVGDAVQVRLHYRATEPVTNPVANITISVLDGNQVTGMRTDVDNIALATLQGRGYIDVIIPELNLLPNIYTINATLFHGDGFTFYDRIKDASHFKVTGGFQVNGTTYLPHHWQFSELTAPVQVPEHSRVS